MGAFFSLTTPMGIVIGILVTNTYKENSSTALIVEGVLNSASAGILILWHLLIFFHLTLWTHAYKRTRCFNWVRMFHFFWVLVLCHSSRNGLEVILCHILSHPLIRVAEANQVGARLINNHSTRYSKRHLHASFW